MMKRMLIAFLFALLLIAPSASVAENKLTVLFTSDIHSWFNTGVAERDGDLHEHGGAGRLQTLLEQNDVANAILVDAGDFAMGTLLQSGYTTDAYELRLMGQLGYTATTFGNHEFDPGATGAASMLRAAKASGDPLPVLLIPANLDLSGTLTPAAQDLANALAEAGSSRYILREVNGVRVAVFGLMGNNAILCTSEHGVTWQDPIEAAQKVVKEIGNQADVIICVSHGGTDQSGKGEDANLIAKVKEIDVVISGHAHVAQPAAIVVRNGSVLGAAGCYLTYLGRMDLSVLDNGEVRVDDYKLIPIDETVASDPQIDKVMDGYWQEIGDRYLTGYRPDDVIAHTDFTLPDVRIAEELPLGALIADSYLYACRQAGYDDIDVAIVGMGTVRAPLLAGDITVENAFEVCSLGFGKDWSAGHPLISGWVSGSDLKLLAELEAFVGSFYTDILMNYSGLSVKIDTNRAPLDRVTSISIIRDDGTLEPLQASKRYRVCANLYAVNMLGNLCAKVNNLLTIAPSDAEGKPIPSDQYYDFAVKNPNGADVKEWMALVSYLSSFDQQNGVPQMPETYRNGPGHKIVTHGNLWDAIRNPGLSTIILMILGFIVILVPVLLIVTRKQRKARRAARKARKAAKK